MVKEYQYVSIRRVLDNLLDHPLLREVNLDQAIRYTIRFIGLFGFSKMYRDKLADIPIHDFRGLLPKDLISIIQVKDLRTGVCLRHMTDNYIPAHVSDQLKKHAHISPTTCCTKPKDNEESSGCQCSTQPVQDDSTQHECFTHPMNDIHEWYIPFTRRYFQEPAFKTQGRCLYTSFPNGVVGVSYKAIPTDKEGFPLLIDNETYLAALEAYIKKQVFTVKFDTGDISLQVLQNAQRDYAVLAAELQSEFQMPSVSEMESISRMLTDIIPRVTEFDNGFTNLGDREYLRKH